MGGMQIIISKISQAQKSKHCMISYVESEHLDITEVESRMVMKGQGDQGSGRREDWGEIDQWVLGYS
jgi:hypothetical protein